MNNHKEIIDKIRPELDKVIIFLERELQNIRSSRASPSLVENLTVECFGQKFPLKQLAALSSPTSKEILIQPWDKSYLEPILKAISQSNLPSSPIIERDLIKISFPPLSEELRKDLMRILSEKTEQARLTIRRWREEAWKEIQGGFREGKIREDDKYRGKDDLQKLIDEYNEKIEEMVERKKKEIME